MSKSVGAYLACALCAILLCSCGYTGVESAKEDNTSMFVRIERTCNWQIVYHKDTKVMYAVSDFEDKGVFTVLVNPDGTPMIYKEDENGR